MNDLDPGRLAPADRLVPETLPRVAQLLAGHLHEEWASGAGSAAEAVYDSLREMDFDDVEELAAEWRVFAGAARQLELEEVNRIVRERFRSGWRIASRVELDAVSQELESALRE